jgi:antitoxin YefM
MNATTVREAKKNLQRLIEQVNADAEPTIICGNQGQKAVLLSFEEFNSWQETLYLLSNPANAEHLRQSIAEAKAGKTLVRCPLSVESYGG